MSVTLTTLPFWDSWTFQPAKPGSSASFFPFPLRSWKAVPVIDQEPALLPKSSPVRSASFTLQFSWTVPSADPGVSGRRISERTNYSCCPRTCMG